MAVGQAISISSILCTIWPRTLCKWSVKILFPLCDASFWQFNFKGSFKIYLCFRIFGGNVMIFVRNLKTFLLATSNFRTYWSTQCRYHFVVMLCESYRIEPRRIKKKSSIYLLSYHWRCFRSLMQQETSRRCHSSLRQPLSHPQLEIITVC